MLKGAPTACRSANGEYLERQGLAPYLAHGYVPFDLDTNRPQRQLDLRQPRRRLGLGRDHPGVRGRRFRDRPVRRSLRRRQRAHTSAFIRRAQELAPPLRTATAGKIEPRYANGAFPPPLRQPRGRRASSRATPFSTRWMVPHDPAGLFRRDRRSDRGRDPPRPLPAPAQRRRRRHPHDHALLGNEPTLNVPWLYDWTRRPFKTQAAVRRAILRLYGTIPGRLPRQRRPRQLSVLVRVRRARPLPRGARRRTTRRRQPAVPAGGDPAARGGGGC